jgi:putative redox protein
MSVDGVDSVFGVAGEEADVSNRQSLQVVHVGADRFTVRVRDHVVHVDQPREAGGFDTAPTPTELLAASLASCVAFYARRYLARHHLPEVGLAVSASYTMATRPARVAEIEISVDVPDVLTVEQRRALLAVASHCTVHNTLEQPPEVTVALRDSVQAIA